MNCIDCGWRTITVRAKMLCATCYKRHQRNKTLWQYPNVADYDPTSLYGLTALENNIRWIFDYNYPELEEGLREYLDGYWTAVLDFDRYNKRSVGFLAYDELRNNKCFECGDTHIVGRGLCDLCYNVAKNAGLITQYPTNDYVNNPNGYINWILNNHFERVVTIAKQEYGVNIENQLKTTV